MTKREKTFFIIWGMILFPLLLLFLLMKCDLDKSMITPFLTFMAAMKAVYAGSDGFNNWNSTPDAINPPLDDEGH